MRKLPDNEFDRLFREKSEQFDYSFEEDAWLKMEKKLRRRDRIILFRNTSIVLLLLLCSLSGYYLITTKTSSNVIATKKQNPDESVPMDQNFPVADASEPSEKAAGNRPATKKLELTHSQYQDSVLRPGTSVPLASSAHKSREKPRQKKVSYPEPPASFNNGADTQLSQVSFSELGALAMAGFDSAAVVADPLQPEYAQLPLAVAAKRNEERKRKMAFSFSFAAGPDFSSISSIAGKKANLSSSVLLNLQIRKFRFSTGARYGLKNYSATSYDYQLSNSSRAKYITGIDASCNVLEIPLQGAYLLHQDLKNKVFLSTGISSYFMLKEEYLFKYSRESGYKDYLLKKRNENQHYFSVISVGGLYQFKPVNKHLTLGIEPYAKIPLGGVGEGSVKLKSSGISINLTYELSKKH